MQRYLTAALASFAICISVHAKVLISIRNNTNHNANIVVVNADNGKDCSAVLGIPKNRVVKLTDAGIRTTSVCATAHMKVEAYRFTRLVSDTSETFDVPGSCLINNTAYVHYNFTVDCF